MKKDCFKYKEWLQKEQKENKSGDKVNKVDEEKREYLFPFSDKPTEAATKADDDWLVDSGATSCVTNNKQ